MSEKQYNYIYKLTNNVNGKMYIGCHCTDNLEDYYMGSGKELKQDMKKYGRYNFTKEILKNFDTYADARKCEQLLVNNEWCNREDTYNKICGGSGRAVGFKQPDDVRSRISNTMQGRIRGKYNVKSNNITH